MLLSVSFSDPSTTFCSTRSCGVFWDTNRGISRSQGPYGTESSSCGSEAVIGHDQQHDNTIFINESIHQFPQPFRLFFVLRLLTCQVRRASVPSLWQPERLCCCINARNPLLPFPMMSSARWPAVSSIPRGSRHACRSSASRSRAH